MLLITSCPQRLLDRQTPQLLRLASMYEKGLPPVTGGALDQSQWFIEACDFLWAEQAHLKRALGK